MTPSIIGLLMLAIPALLVGVLLLWRRHRAVFFFFLALLAVGLGYLFVTGAADDVYFFVVGEQVATTLEGPVAIRPQPAQ